MSAGGEETTGYRSSLPWRLYNGASQLIDRRIGWHRLPTPLGLLP